MKRSSSGDNLHSTTEKGIVDDFAIDPNPTIGEENNTGSIENEAKNKRPRTEDSNCSSSLPSNTVANVPVTETVSALQAIATGDLGPALGVKPGVQLEVLWTLEPDSEGEGTEKQDSEEVWWRCSVEERTRESHNLGDESGDVVVPVYKLKYEPRGTFEETISTVCFTDEHELFDIEFDGFLEWRRVGEEWDPNTALGCGATSVPRNPVLALFDKLWERAPGVLSASDTEINTDADGAQRSPQDAAETAVNRIMADILEKHSKTLKQYPANVQFFLTDRVSKARERLVSKIASHIETHGVLDEAGSREIVESMADSMKNLS